MQVTCSCYLFSAMNILPHSSASGVSPNIFHQTLPQQQFTGATTHYGMPLLKGNVSQQVALGESWHPGHSPYRYELTLLPSRVKKGYGCGLEFTDNLRQSPNNIIVKHVDRRLVRRDERTGLFHYSADFSNTYYHFDHTHISRKNPLFNGKVKHFIATLPILGCRTVSCYQ